MPTALTPEQQSLDTRLGMLSHLYRRTLILALADRNPLDADDFLAESFLADNSAPERVALKLHHIHLPRLATHGYIEWNPETGTIRQGPQFDDIASLLRVLTTHEAAVPDD